MELFHLFIGLLVMLLEGEISSLLLLLTIRYSMLRL